MKRVLVFLSLMLIAALAAAATVPRPAGNTGHGFYVAPTANLGGVTVKSTQGTIENVPVAPGTHVYRIITPAGLQWIPRGFNRVHPDSWGTAAKDMSLTGTNAVRMNVMPSWPAAKNLALLADAVGAGIVPMPSQWGGTCKSDVASLNTIVDAWVAQAATWTTINDTGIINIANEWGPPNSTVWRDAYVAAIPRMRAAGYTGLLVVDSGGCGQDANDIIKYGADVLAADPQHNILFDVHVYGGFSFPATVAWQNDYTKSMAALKATGLPIILGEFGPGQKIGPSPTMITPQQVIATAEGYGWGWLAWAWDDNNLGGCAADDQWFSMTTKCGQYTGKDTELTAFGKTIVPILKSKAVKAVLH